MQNKDQVVFRRRLEIIRFSILNGQWTLSRTTERRQRLLAGGSFQFMAKCTRLNYGDHERECGRPCREAEVGGDFPQRTGDYKAQVGYIEKR